jgi:hypothetical protein
MRRFATCLFTAALLVLAGCGPAPEAPPAGAEPQASPAAAAANPPAPGFDETGSDAAAIEIADRTMAAMGGREAWDHTRYVAWNFFGHRFLVWDKWTGNVRVELEQKDAQGQSEGPLVIALDIDTKQGRAWIDGAPVEDPARLAELVQQGYEIWVNDSYWVFMPYKLKDSGVTLRSLGDGSMTDGRPADVLELTFHDVGVTPENKYHVYVARDSGLVEQWDYFDKAADEAPRFQVPWHGWQRYDGILLSGDRGRAQISEISVHDELPPTVFSSPAPTGLREPAQPTGPAAGS